MVKNYTYSGLMIDLNQITKAQGLNTSGAKHPHNTCWGFAHLQIVLFNFCNDDRQQGTNNLFAQKMVIGQH